MFSPSTTVTTVSKDESSKNASALKKFVEENQRLAVECSNLLTQCKRWEKEADEREKEAEIRVHDLKEDVRKLSEELNFYKCQYEAQVAAKVPVKEYEFDHKKLANVQSLLEQLVANYLNQSAKEAYRSYLLSYNSHSMKEIFNVHRLDLQSLMVRRTKSQLMELGTLVLPPLTEITVMAPLVALQKKVYMPILRKELTQLLALASGAPNTRSLQNIVVRRRDVA